MLVLYLLGCFVSGTFCRQSPAVPAGLAIYRTPNPGQFLVQPIAKTTTEIPEGYSQIAVVVIPRHQILRGIGRSPVHVATTAESQDQDEYPEDEVTTNTIKPERVTYSQLLPYNALKQRIYPKQPSPSVEQFLKEVTPTTRTIYSEQQSASLRYAQATSPPQTVDQDGHRQHRIIPQGVPLTYTLQPEPQTESDQPANYPQTIQPQHLIQVQPNIHHQQLIQPYPYHGARPQYITREHPSQQKIQQIQPQTTHGTLTYIPINPVMFQKPLVEDDAPSAKSAIYVSQKTAVKKYQAPQPIPEEENEDNIDSPPPPPPQSRKDLPRIIAQHLIPLPPQQILIPIIPQPQPTINDNRVHPEFIRYPQIQQIQSGQHHTQHQPILQQQILIPIRPKKVPPQLIRQPPQQNVVTYQPLPIQQLQHADPAALPRPPTIRYILPHQVLPHQPIQLISLRPLPPQQESLDYDSPQEAAQTQHSLQTDDTNEDKPDTQLPQPIQRQQIKRKKSGLRSRKYRPSRLQQETEEEIQNENQESNNPEDFRIQYPDGLKTQATTFGGLRYRRPIHITEPNVSVNKDRAVQIIDREDEDYK